MHESNLVGVHETGIAHHVAAVGEVDCQYRSTAVLDCRGAVVVELFVAVRADVAARENFFEMPEEHGVDGHYIFEVSMLRAIFHHQDLALALDDLRLDFAGLFVQQDFLRKLAVNDLLADLRYAFRTERVGRTRPSQGWLLLFVGLEERLVRPLRRERRIGLDAVEAVKNLPGTVGGNCQCLLNILNRFRHPCAPRRDTALWGRRQISTANHYRTAVSYTTTASS